MRSVYHTPLARALVLVLFFVYRFVVAHSIHSPAVRIFMYIIPCRTCTMSMTEPRVGITITALAMARTRTRTTYVIAVCAHDKQQPRKALHPPTGDPPF